MRFLKTRLFFTIVVVVCLAGAFMGITRAHAASVETTHPLTSQPGNTSSNMVSLNISGGGCTTYNERWGDSHQVSACIGIDSNGMLQPDGYANKNAFLLGATITLIDNTGGKKYQLLLLR